MIFKSPYLNPLHYHACGCDTGMLHMSKTTNNAELKTALLSIWNDLPQEFTDKAILLFQKKLRSLRFCVAAAGRSLNTQFKYRDGS